MESSKTHETTLSEFAGETTTEGITRCVVLPLETSERKTTVAQECIDEWQAIARKAAELMPSFPSYRWGGQDTQLYRTVVSSMDEDERTITARDASEAAKKASESFESWNSNGQPGKRPIGEFGDADYMRMHSNGITIVENDRGYGVKLGLIPYHPEWFHIDSADYHREYLDRILSEENTTRHGSGELRVNEDGSLALHLTVTDEVEVYEPDGVERWLGVDCGEKAIYAMAMVGERSGEIGGVNVESGKEYRHYRERLKRKRAELGAKGDLRGVRECKGDIERYTDQILHTCSREIVDHAAEHEPCAIVLEDLTGYREDADDPIHDWPYAELQEQICYKATAAGIPVVFIDSTFTSQECNRCGQRGLREGPSFECRRCDYEVHADVNAAINIAQRGIEE